MYYCNRLSFAEVSKLLERVSGQRLLCEQTLCNWVERKAREVGAALSLEVDARSRSLALPTFAESVDIYDADSEEVLVSTDAIQVKAQKPSRERRRGAQRDTPEEKGKKAKKKRINTDLMLIQGRDGSFRHLLSAGPPVGGEGPAASLREVARAYLRREWGEHPEPVPIVAITDGARSIRLMLEDLFGPSVRVILDWYHLAKKIYQLLSMVAHSKAERERMEGRVLSFLWHGRLAEALSYLGGVSARRQEALTELVTYLEKHACEIIDYERRAKAGKVMGAGGWRKRWTRRWGCARRKRG